MIIQINFWAAVVHEKTRVQSVPSLSEYAYIFV